MKKLTLVTLAICALPLTGCVTYTPEMKAKGCTLSDASKLKGMNIGMPLRAWGIAKSHDAALLEEKYFLELFCGVDPGTMSADDWRAELAI